MTRIEYHDVKAFDGWAGAPAAVKALIRAHGCRRILEVGSGANPTLDANFVSAEGLDYTVNDISEDELAKADLAYQRLVMDVSKDEPTPTMQGRFDFIFSRMVNEHVADGRLYYANIHRMLRQGGVSVHWFSTLYALPFVANKLMPEWLGERLLRACAPRDSHKLGKFAAHYHWSRGPTRRMIRRFEELGFEILQYSGYFGHTYYRLRLPWLHRLEEEKSRFLLWHPIAHLTSYARVLLRKRPVDGTESPQS